MGLEAENATLRQEKRELRTENAALKARIIELEEAVAALHGKGSQPPSFVKANKRKPKEKKPRKKRASPHNQSRQRETPTRVETHRLEKCPGCGDELTRHKASYTRQIIDIPPSS
jgi:DNA repair exonuclease SbcCD ATPase subunit